MLKMVAPGSLFVQSVVAEGGSSAEPLDVRCGKRLGGFAPSSSTRAGQSGMKGSGAMRPSSMFYVHEADIVQIHHFLDECSLCDKSLSGDIFMYRSDRTFEAPHTCAVCDEASSSVCFVCVQGRHAVLQRGV
jgi:hypothetical protein